MPVWHASTILYPTLADFRRPAAGKIKYGRKGTPTSRALLEAVWMLESGGKHKGGGVVLTPSGLAAVTLAILACVERGDHILVSDGVYEPTRMFCDGILAGLGVETDYYPPTDLAALAAGIKPNSKLIFTESPSSQSFEIQDIPAIAELAHKAGALVLMDNSWATPLFCRPLDLGADISIQALTKYPGGHADLLLGTAAARDEAVYARLRKLCTLIGIWTGPDDMAMALRGMRSLEVRLARHQENALALAQFLAQRAEVARVIHPALPSHPQHALWQRDFTGATGLFAVQLKPEFGEQQLAAMLDNMRYFAMGYSWGGYESLIIPVEPVRGFAYLGGDAEGQLLRIHAGLEDKHDLIADLQDGLARLHD